MHPKNKNKFEYCNIPYWHEQGYTGAGVKVAVFERLSGHGGMVADVVKQVAPGVEILERPRPTIKSRNGRLIEGTYENLKAFYQSLVDEGVNLVVMSLGGNSNLENEQLQKDILIANGIALVTSAGNSGKKMTGSGRLDTWISVGACSLINGKPVRKDFSSIGEWLDTCSFDGIYLTTGGYFTGTSAAAPIVVGMLALWCEWRLQVYGRYPVFIESYNFIKNNSQDMEKEGHDINTGYGLFVLPKEIEKVESDGDKVIKVGLDFGHGGKDPGAIGNNGLLEKDVNLDVGLQVKQLLEASGIKVVTTRVDDSYISPDDRINKLNNANVDFVLSIHVNSSTNKDANYISPFVFSRGIKAETAAIIIQRNLVNATRWEDGGVKVKNLHMVRETKAPAVLVELGFISNLEQEQWLEVKENRAKLAVALAAGICEYLGVVFNMKEKEQRFTDVPTDHWAKGAIEKASDAKIMGGYPDGTFRPDDTVTRAELAAVVVRLLQMK